MSSNPTESTTPVVSAFKQAQLRHRRRGDNPHRTEDLVEVVDFGRPGGADDNIIIPLSLPCSSCPGTPCTSPVKPLYEGAIYGLKGFPGFMFAPQALEESLQFELAYHSVSRYCEKPHTTNIDQCPPKPSEDHNENDSMWVLWKQEHHALDAMKKRKSINSDRKKYRSFKKLSWATMGYHYDWTERSYDEDHQSEMPSLVGDLSNVFARTSLLMTGGTQSSVHFTPSASIVNYYSTKSNMGGHRDDLELALDKPIVSFSVGLPAIFLLGGKTKEETPVIPILIRPGDVMCMGGDTRLNYHAMARLLPDATALPDVDLDICPEASQQISLEKLGIAKLEMSKEDREYVELFLSLHRININVRQVYPDSKPRF